MKIFKLSALSFLFGIVLFVGCGHNNPPVIDPGVSTTPVEVPTAPPFQPSDPGQPPLTPVDVAGDDAIIAAVLANGEIEDNPRNATGGDDRAVIFGNNFPNSNAELHECVRDAKKNIVNLVKFDHFSTKSIRLFTDRQCTKKNYEKWATWVLANAKPGDRRFFGNSSHGAEDTSSDGKIYDIIVTDDMVRLNAWDSSTEVSPEFWSTLLRSTTVNFVFLNDACHAGGAMKSMMSFVAAKNKRTIRSIDGPAPVQARLNTATQRGPTLRALALTGVVLPACQPSELSEEDSVHGGLATDATWAARKNLPVTAKSSDIVREANRILRNEYGASQHEGLIGVNKPLYSVE